MDIFSLFAFALGGLFALMGLGLAAELVSKVLEQRHQRALAEVEVRRIEALGRLAEPEQKLLLESMPEWLDRADADEVEAWKKARAEVVGTARS